MGITSVGGKPGGLEQATTTPSVNDPVKPSTAEANPPAPARPTVWAAQGGRTTTAQPGLVLNPAMAPVPGPPSIRSNLDFLVWTAGSAGDAGDFYCEHVLFMAEQAARAEGSSIVKDGDQNPMVGFIHLPRTSKPEATSRVIAAALAGYVGTLRTAVPAPEPLRIAMTGFGTWNDVKNPSGEFLTEANLTRSMRLAFGAAVKDPAPVALPNGQGWSYTIDDATTGTSREVQVLTRQLPVNDPALQGERSVTDLLERTRAHASISMGMAPGASNDYQIESRADDGGLQHDKKVRHNGTLDARFSYPRNEALWRAISRGWQAPW